MSDEQLNGLWKDAQLESILGYTLVPGDLI